MGEIRCVGTGGYPYPVCKKRVYKERNIASVGDGTAISISIKICEIIYLINS